MCTCHEVLLLVLLLVVVRALLCIGSRSLSELRQQEIVWEIHVYAHVGCLLPIATLIISSGNLCKECM